MPELKAVLDTTILASAFLRNVPGGVSHDLLRFAGEGAFELYVCDDILEETARVLLRDEKKRRRYAYSDVDVVAYCQELALLGMIVDDLPEVHVVRDPNDDVIVACAIAAGAMYLVTRDKDLLTLDGHEGISIVSPETFLRVLRTR
jgi:putative PIN family toxin of toxin-antitoxin system